MVTAFAVKKENNLVFHFQISPGLTIDTSLCLFDQLQVLIDSLTCHCWDLPRGLGEGEELLLSKVRGQATRSLNWLRRCLSRLMSIFEKVCIPGVVVVTFVQYYECIIH